MALIGFEVVIVVMILVVVFMWSPKKLPELARALVEARKEIQRTSSSVQDAEPKKNE